MRPFICTTALILGCFGTAAAQSASLATDSLTALPLMPTHAGQQFGNAPVHMPDATICKSKYRGNFYSLSKVKADAAVAWYAGHLKGFKHTPGYDGQRSQDQFSAPDGSVVVIVTGDPGPKGAITDAYSVAYERYEPGLSVTTLTSLTQGKIVCK